MSNGLKMKYFVLKPAGNSLHARASRKAMRAYASMIETDKANADFASDLRNWADEEMQNTQPKDPYPEVHR